MKIFLCTPSYRGIQHLPFLESLEKTMELLQYHGHEATFTLLKGCCYVQVGRNDLVWQFLRSDADVLFFLDDDISWPAEAALKLIHSGDDIIAGVYPLKNDSGIFPVTVKVGAHEIPVHRPDGCVEVV